MPTVHRTERFFSRAMVGSLAAYLGFLLTFGHFQVRGDSLVYFNLMRRFFGEHPDSAFAYQFGSDVWNWPFFLIGRGLGLIFGLEPKTFHVTFEELAMTVSANVALLATLYLGWRLLRQLDLPRGPAVLFLTVFGSPLFHYTVFEPAGKHAVDTLVITASVLLTLNILEGPTRDWHAAGLGALAGVSVNIRYVNVAFFLAIACALALRRGRAFTIAAITAVAVGPTVFGLPALRGISYFVPSYFPKSQAVAALGVHPIVGSVSNPLNGFDPSIPLKMLFSEHRGLFLWTPLTALALIGYMLFLRRTHDSDRRAFLWTIAAAALALLLMHSIWGQWDGGFAFSERFLTSLFPIFLIGVAALRRDYGRLMYPALCVCASWALMVAFVHDVGYDRVSERDGIYRIATVIHDDQHTLRHKVSQRAEKRWGYIWALFHGRDSEHVHGA